MGVDRARRFRRSLDPSQQLAAGQTAAAAEQARSGSADGEGRRGQRERGREQEVKADAGGVCSRQGRKVSAVKIHGYTRATERAPRFARHL